MTKSLCSNCGELPRQHNRTRCLLCIANDRIMQQELTKAIDNVLGGDLKRKSLFFHHGASSPHKPTAQTHYQASNSKESVAHKSKKQRVDDFGVEKFLSQSASFKPNRKNASEKPRPHICKECGLGCIQKSHLDEHMSSVHKAEKPFVCDVDGCAKSFARKFTLNTHKKIHNRPDEPFQCDICKAGFNNNALLVKHKRKIHNIYEFVECSLCNIKFNTPSQLQSHNIYVHSTDRSFRCIQCDSSFKTQGDLTRHVKYKHEITEAFICSKCGGKFNWKHNLTSHAKTCRGKWQ